MKKLKLRKELKKLKNKFLQSSQIGRCNVFYITHQELPNGHHEFSSQFVSVDNIVGAVSFASCDVNEILNYLNKKYNGEKK